MEPGLQSIYDEIKILRTSKISFQVDCEDGQSCFAKNQGTDLWSRVFASLIILYEFVVWIIVIIVGVKYILSIDPSDIGNVVQASVAVGFIDQIDDMALFIYGKMGGKTKTDHFCCTKPTCRLSSAIAFHTIFAIFGISFLLAYGLHNSYC